MYNFDFLRETEKSFRKKIFLLEYRCFWNNGLVQNWEKSIEGCILSPSLFNLYAEYIMRNAGLDEAQAGIKIAGEDINNLRYAGDTILTAEREIKKTVSFTTASKRIKYLGMDLAKEVKELLELDMEQWTGSKVEKECIKAVYCHPAYLTYMQSTLCEMPGWMKHKLESRCWKVYQ